MAAGAVASAAGVFIFVVVVFTAAAAAASCCHRCIRHMHAYKRIKSHIPKSIHIYIYMHIYRCTHGCTKLGPKQFGQGICRYAKCVVMCLLLFRAFPFFSI